MSSSTSPTRTQRESVLLALTDRAEVFVESWRPGVADRLGLDYDTLHARNPALVYVSISGFGEEPGDAELPGYEADCACGARQHVRSGRSSRRPGVHLVSRLQAWARRMLAVIGALAALRRAAGGWIRPPRQHIAPRRGARLQLHALGGNRRVGGCFGEHAVAVSDHVDDASRDAFVRMLQMASTSGSTRAQSVHSGAR